MENFAKPSVLKNHKNSFMSSVKSIEDLIHNLSNDYSQVADRLSKYSQKRQELIQSVESKFKNYNFKFKEPLITNSNDEIIKYAEDFQSELAISLASLKESEKEKVLDDSLAISSDITQIKMVNSYIDKETNNLLSYEDELSKIRIPEKDSKEETIINFNSLKNKKVEEEPQIEENSFELDGIDSSIFDDASKDEEELSSFLDGFNEDDENFVSINLKNGSSLADKVEFVYGDRNTWLDVYNFNELNKAKIDNVAENLGKSVEEVVNDPNALADLNLDFPTELNVEEDVKKLA